jgi:hypothetical protein
MSNRAATFAKRQREVEQKERAAQRIARKSERKTRADASSRVAAGGDPDVDPDLVGIVPGPQPRPDDDEVPAGLSAAPEPVPSDDRP